MSEGLNEPVSQGKIVSFRRHSGCLQGISWTETRVWQVFIGAPAGARRRYSWQTTQKVTFLRHIVLTALLDVFQLRSEAALNPLKYQFRGEKVVGGSRYVKLLPLSQIIIIWKERKRMSSNSVLFLRKLFRGHSFKRLFSARRKIFQTYEKRNNYFKKRSKLFIQVRSDFDTRKLTLMIRWWKLSVSFTYKPKSTRCAHPRVTKNDSPRGRHTPATPD